MSTAGRGWHMRRAPSIGLGVVLALALLPPVTAYAADPPANDNFHNPQPLETLPQTFADIDIASASWEPGERWPCAPEGSTANTVWFTFTYNDVRDGFVQVDAPGATVTAFYLPSGSTVADLSPGYCRGTSTLLIPWYPNRTEYVQVAGDGSGSPITVTFTWVPLTNDNLAQAQPVALGFGTFEATTTVDTRLATIERVPGTTQPQPYDIPRCFSGSFTFSRSVWYAFVALQPGVLTIDPSGSSFPDVTLTAYGLPWPGGIPSYATRVGCARPRLPLTFRVWPGDVYYVQSVDGVPTGGTLSGGGTLEMSWSLDVGPVLTVPAEITVEATGPAGAAVTFEVSAMDSRDGPRPVTCDRRSGSTFPIGYTWVLCSASDLVGTVTYDYVRVHVRDSVPPVMTLPGDITVEATGPGGAPVSYEVSAVDAIHGPLAVSCTKPSGSEFPIGSTIVSCTTTDPSGNATSGQFSITVRHTDAPVLTLPSEVIVEATYMGGASVSYEVGAFDAVDGPRPVTCDRQSGTLFPLGSTTVSCATSDTAGNTATGSFEIIVRDTTPPELRLPADITVEADGATGSSVPYIASAFDLVQVVQVGCEPTAGFTFPIGTTTVSCEATDAAGNVARRSFRVTVQDTVAPTVLFGSHPDVLTVAQGIQIPCSSWDAVGVVTSTCATTDLFGWQFGLGLHSYSATATDAAGNVGSATTEFTVIATYGSMSDLTRQWVTRAGVARDLIALLDSAAAAERRGQTQAKAAKLGDYRALVNAQAGKSITATQAAMLVAFSYGL